MFIKLLCVYCSLPLKEVTSQYKAVQSESWMLVGEQSANRNRATSKWESVLAVLKDLCWNTFTNQFGTTRQEIWIKVAQPEPTIQARWGKNISMISACDLISSFHIVMIEDLTWQQTQSTDPFSDQVATQEKQTEETVCLGGTTDAVTPVIQVVFL